MVLTQKQIDTFEAERVGFWQKLTGKSLDDILQGLQYNLQAQQVISDQLASLTQALTGTTPATAPVGGPLVNTEIALTLPMTLRELNQFILATPDAQGYVTSYMTQLASIVPAAGVGGPGTFTFTYAVPPGYVAASIAPWLISTDSVAANISASISVDGRSIILPVLGLTFGPPMEIPGVQYIVATTTGLETVYTNNTSAPVTVYVQAELMLIARSFYDSFYAKLLSFGYGHIVSSLGLGVK